MNTKCIIALGNPGQEYRDTRHNVAQRVFSQLERHSVLSWETKQKLYAEICFWIPNGAKKKFMLIKPTVYMNESGKTVNNVCAYFGIKSDEIIVIHDELDLVPGARQKYNLEEVLPGITEFWIFTNPFEIKSSRGYV